MLRDTKGGKKKQKPLHQYTPECKEGGSLYETMLPNEVVGVSELQFQLWNTWLCALHKSGFFQHFRENSTAKKTQFLPHLKKLKAIFGPKLNVGAAFI